jgi:hypothetical protein
MLYREKVTKRLKCLNQKEEFHPIRLEQPVKLLAKRSFQNQHQLCDDSNPFQNNSNSASTTSRWRMNRGVESQGKYCFQAPLLMSAYTEAGCSLSKDQK